MHNFIKQNVKNCLTFTFKCALCCTSNKQQATSNKQQATSNKQQATGNKQQATGNKRSNLGKNGCCFLTKYRFKTVKLFHLSPLFYNNELIPTNKAPVESCISQSIFCMPSKPACKHSHIYGNVAYLNRLRNTNSKALLHNLRLFWSYKGANTQFSYRIRNRAAKQPCCKISDEYKERANSQHTFAQLCCVSKVLKRICFEKGDI